MAHFTIQLPSPHSVTDTWSRVVDWEKHGTVAPLTKVAIAGGPARVQPDLPAVGEKFVARTGIGPLKLHDVMRVTSVEVSASSRRVTVEKVGRLLKGTVRIVVEPASDDGKVVLLWTQDFRVALLPGVVNRLIGPLLSMVVAIGYRYALRKLVAQDTRQRA